MSSSNNNTSTTNCSIMHSYPFINDGPKVKKSKKTPKIQVPIGVLHIKPSWKPVKLDEKPPFSYATIIAHAILSSEQRKLTLSEIYQWISEQYPCYSMKDHRWQNSIRHNLSLQKAFAKLDRDSTTPSGKGCYWTILPGYEHQFIDNLVKRGGLRAPSSSVKPNTHKQFKKFIHSNQSNNTHLFTIFRMNPAPSSPPPCKKKKIVKQEEVDSDCDSAVDVNFSNKELSMNFDFDSTYFDMMTPSMIVDDYNMFDNIWPMDNASLSSGYSHQDILNHHLYDFNVYNNSQFTTF